MLFTFFPLILNKTQTLSSSHIVCVGLVLYLGLFDYKFALICGGVVLMLNLIIVVVIKKNCPIHVGWVGFFFFDPPWWVGLKNSFNLIHAHPYRNILSGFTH